MEFSIEESQPAQPTTRLESRVDDIEILQSREHTDSYAVSSSTALLSSRTGKASLQTYLLDAGKRDREPVYSDELGLAIEKLPSGYTLGSLWDILN